MTRSRGATIVKGRGHVAAARAETRRHRRQRPKSRRSPKAAPVGQHGPTQRFPVSPRCSVSACRARVSAHFTVFVLACFVGYMVVWNVKPALHTPLMSVTNAISSIIIIGALLQVSAADPAIMWIAGGTVLLTSINIAGGFAVTRRMLDMFRK